MKLLEESFGATKAAEKAKLEWNASENGNSFLTGFLTSNFSLCVEQPMILSKVRLFAALLKNLHWLPISVSLRAKVLAKAYRQAPHCISQPISYHSPTGSLHSSYTCCSSKLPSTSYWNLSLAGSSRQPRSWLFPFLQVSAQMSPHLRGFPDHTM